MRIGYMRPSQKDPNCDFQLKTLMPFDCTKLVKEDHSSAKKRTELEKLLSHLQKSDKVIVTSFFSLADSTRHLVELLEVFEEKGAFLQSVKESVDTSSSESQSFFHIVKHLVDFQSDVISEKTKKGMHEAKQKGIATGRPRKPDENVQRAIIMYESKKYSLAEIKAATGISKSTLYRYLEN